jgi:DNA-binding transcriptional MerR regulator
MWRSSAVVFRVDWPQLATSSELEVKREMLLDIAQVARQSGTPASALRFYEEKGLIASVGRRGLRRLFEPSVLERLSLIALGRLAGFTLDEIAGMFAADGRPSIDRAVLRAKADELDLTIQRLTVMREGLRHAAACPAPSHMECPKFRRIVLAAGTGKLKPPRRRVYVAEGM